MSDVSHRIALILELTDAKLREGVKAVSRVLDGLEKGVQAASAKAGAAMENFEDRTKAALDKVKTPAKETEKAVDGIATSATKAAKSVERSTDKMAAAAQKMAQKAARAAMDTTSSFEAMESSFAKVGERIKSGIFSLQTAIVGLGAFKFGQAAVNSAVDFQSALGQVKIVATDSGKSIDELRGFLLDLSKTTPIDLVDLTKSLGDAIGKLPKGANQAAIAIDALSAAQEAARASGSTAAQVLDGIIPILNTYGKTGITAAEITDKLFAAFDQGGATVPELSASLGQIVGIAAQFGISIDELLGEIAVLTRGGQTASEAITNLRQALISTARPPENVAVALKALGVEFGTAALKSKGLVGILEDLQAKGGTSELEKLYTDTQGFLGVSTLLGAGLKQVREDIALIGDASGKTDEAVSKISGNFEQMAGIAKNRLGAAMIEIGERIMPTVARVLTQLADYAEKNGTQIADGIGRAVDALEKLGQWVATYGPSILSFFLVFKATSFFSGLVKDIAGAVTALHTFSQGLAASQALGEGFASLGGAAGGKFTGGFAGKLKGLGGIVKGALSSPGIIAAATTAFTIGYTIGTKLMEALGDAIEAGTQKQIIAAIDDLDRQISSRLKALGARTVDEAAEIGKRIRSGAAVKGVGGKLQTLSEVQEQAPAAVTAAFNAGMAEISAQVKEAQAGTARAAKAMAEAAAKIDDVKRSKGTDAEIAKAEADHASAQAIVVAAARRVEELTAGAAALTAQYSEVTAKAAADAKEQADAAERPLKEKIAAEKAKAEAAKAAARDAKREADQARREREREAADAIRDLGKLQGDALKAEGASGLAFLESAIEAQELAIEQARALGATALEDLERAGGSVEDMAIEEQRGLLRVQSLLREQIGLIEALRLRREKAAEESATREMNIAREAAAERAKYLSPDAQRQQQEELGRLHAATELQTAAEITKIRSESAKSVAELEDRLREQRAAAELAFQRQIAEGTKRAVGATGFKEAGDEPPPPKAAAALRGLIGTIWTSLVEGGQDVVEGLGERIAKSASYAADKLSETSAYKLVAGYAEKAADLIASGGKAAADWLQTGAEKATDGLLRGAQFVLGDSLFSRITSVVGQVSDATGTVLKAVGGQIVAAGQAAALIPEKLAAASEELVTGLTGALGAIGDNAAERLGDALTGFTTGISDALTAPLKELLGEDLSKYLSPILDLPANLMRQINGKLLQPALAAATAPFDRLLGGVGEALSALTDPNNTKAALKDRLAEVDAETAKRVQELTAAGRPDEAAKARAEGASQKAEIQREFDKNQPEAVLKRVVDQATEILKRVVESLPALVGKLVDTLITEAPKFIAGIADAIAGILTTLAPKIGPLLTALLNAVLDAVPVIIDALVQAVPQIVDGLLKALIGLIGRLPALLTTLLQGIIDLLPGLFQALADNLPALIIALVDAVPQIIMALVDALPQILTALIEGAGEIVGALIEHLPEIIVAIVKALPQIIWALLKLVPLLVWAVAKGLGLAVARIGIGLGRAGAKLGEWAVMAGKTVYNYLTAAGKWVWKVLTSVGRGAKKAGSWLYDNTIGAIFHSGGHVRRGADPATAVRWAAAGAQRFAAGGFPGAIEASMRRQLHGDEVPILAQVGEAVLNRRAVANMGAAEINARNAGAVPVAAAGPVVAQITPDSRGLDALLRMLIGQIVLTAAQPGTPMNRVLDRRAVPGAKGVR